MGKFSFRLQKLLNIKEKLQEQAEIDLGNAITKLNIEEEVLLSYESSLKGLIDKFNKKNGKKIHVKELLELNTFIKYYNDEITNQKIIINKEKENVEEKRIKLNEAVIETKTYQNLKEIKLEAFLEEEKIENNKLMDEINGYNHLMKSF